jgi:hypothetical protein
MSSCAVNTFQHIFLDGRLRYETVGVLMPDCLSVTDLSGELLSAQLVF